MVSVLISCAESYFQSINSTRNNDFKQRIFARLGEGAIISAPMVSAYNGVNLWRKTVERIKGFNSSSVRQAMLGEMTMGPSGVVRISMLNNHTWNHFYIAKLNTKHGFDIVETIKEPLRPIPFPPYGSKQY